MRARYDVTLELRTSCPFRRHNHDAPAQRSRKKNTPQAVEDEKVPNGPVELLLQPPSAFVMIPGFVLRTCSTHWLVVIREQEKQLSAKL